MKIHPMDVGTWGLLDARLNVPTIHNWSMVVVVVVGGRGGGHATKWSISKCESMHIVMPNLMAFRD